MRGNVKGRGFVRGRDYAKGCEWCVVTLKGRGHAEGRGSARVRAPQFLVPRRPPSRPARHIGPGAGGAAAGDG